MQLTHQKYPGLVYRPEDGTFHRLEKDLINLRRVFPDETYYLSYTDVVKGKQIRKKAIILAYEFLNDKVPKNFRVYPKDLDWSNLRAYNVGCIRNDAYKALNDALINTTNGIKVSPHRFNVHCYVIKYREKGRIKQITCHDIVHALNQKRRIMLKSLKIIGKYVVNR